MQSHPSLSLFLSLCLSLPPSFSHLSLSDPASIPPPGDLSRQAPFGYSYPAMQPNYIQTAPRSNPAPSATGYHAPGYQDMSQVS